MDSSYVALPTIVAETQSDENDIELNGQRGRRAMRRKQQAAWYDDVTSRESVVLRLLDFSNKVETAVTGDEEDEDMTLQDSRPGTPADAEHRSSLKGYEVECGTDGGGVFQPSDGISFSQAFSSARTFFQEHFLF